MGHGSKPGERRGGRQKGTPNKRTASVTEYLKEKGADPIAVLSDLLLGAVEEKDKPQMAYLAIQLAPYSAPKLAASKIEGELVGLTYEEKLAILDKTQE